jgi:hypothetical protein
MNAAIDDLIRQFDAIDQDAAALVAALSAEQAAWKPARNCWSVLQCMEHTSVAARFYLTRINPAIDKGWARRVLNPGPYRYNAFDRFIVRTLEPPYKLKAKTGPMYQTAGTKAPDAVLEDYIAAHSEVRDAVRRADGLDLARIRFRHPHLFLLTFSLGSGFAALAAHARRHLWQARQVRSGR